MKRRTLLAGAVVTRLGGVSGHAGLFGTAADVAVFARALLERTLLRPSTVDLMRAGGLGIDVDAEWYMGRLSGSGAFGHTGFTGTSFVAEPRRRVVLVLLTNRVHPDAGRGSPNQARRTIADIMAA